jgi:hypothetical protein
MASSGVAGRASSTETRFQMAVHRRDPVQCAATRSSAGTNASAVALPSSLASSASIFSSSPPMYGTTFVEHVDRSRPFETGPGYRLHRRDDHLAHPEGPMQRGQGERQSGHRAIGIRDDETAPLAPGQPHDVPSVDLRNQERDVPAIR